MKYNNSFSKLRAYRKYNIENREGIEVEEEEYSIHDSVSPEEKVHIIITFLL
jgi:hypothetical protein